MEVDGVEARLRAELRRHRRPSVVTIGSFDGVHAGHKALVERARAVARDRDLATVAVTFSPRPEVVLAPRRTMSDLCPIAERRRRLLAAGAEEVVVLPFTLELARVSAPTFVAALREDLLAEALCVGEDFALGHGREGDVEAIRELGLEVITPEFVRAADGRKLSSSTMRLAIAQSQAARFAEA
jgi:riboflavin kinase/FMN adenylyltransferase